jgi:hypothetical protein
MICEQLEVFPQASLAIHFRSITVTQPFVTGVPSIELTDGVLHPSVAVAVPKFAVDMFTSHSITTFGGQVIAGGVISLTVMVWLAVAVFPHASIAVHFRVTALALPQLLVVASVNDIVAVELLHASLAVGEEKVGVAGQSMVDGPPTPLITGGVLSLTVIVWLAVAVFPHASVAVHVRVTARALPQLLVVPSVNDIDAVELLHASLAVGEEKVGVAGQSIVDGPPTPLITGG